VTPAANRVPSAKVGAIHDAGIEIADGFEAVDPPLDVVVVVVAVVVVVVVTVVVIVDVTVEVVVTVTVVVVGGRATVEVVV